MEVTNLEAHWLMVCTMSFIAGTLPYAILFFSLNKI